ncbi:hypothetical protein KOW79_006953 [Hemibagrus wyckioides]|uniref:Uncharacterized protein n=1 Tax=Hemibagrus wyckioides TaxID=337641 RepID=A0A9D3NUE0_9TELE|nr:hypothetical protein KOW79_006953 [Hemibagrus wyckioides]
MVDSKDSEDSEDMVDSKDSEDMVDSKDSEDMVDSKDSEDTVDREDMRIVRTWWTVFARLDSDDNSMCEYTDI